MTEPADVEPPAEPVEEPEPVVREAPPEPASAQEEAPLPQKPPRELVFQNDEELEERFRRAGIAEQAAVRLAEEDGCAPEATVGEEQEVGLATAEIDEVLSEMRSVLEGLGLVSAAEAEQETASIPCADTAADSGEGYGGLR